MSRVEEIQRAIDALSDDELSRVADRVRAIEQERRAELAVLVQEGFDAIERGEYEDLDEVSTKLLAEDIKQRGRERLSGTAGHTTFSTPPISTGANGGQIYQR